jgi:hypothetical protein
MTALRFIAADPSPRGHGNETANISHHQQPYDFPEPVPKAVGGPRNSQNKRHNPGNKGPDREGAEIAPAIDDTHDQHRRHDARYDGIQNDSDERAHLGCEKQHNGQYGDSDQQPGEAVLKSWQRNERSRWFGSTGSGCGMTAPTALVPSNGRTVILP